MIITDPQDYQTSRAVSFSRLKVFESRALRYFRWFEDCSEPREDEETKAKRLGTAGHCMVLEGPAIFAERYVIKPATYPAIDKATKQTVHKKWNANAAVCEQWEDAQRAAGKTIISTDEFGQLRKMREGIRTNPDAVRLLSEGQCELAIRRQHPALGLAVQGRLDWWNPAEGVVVDLKTIEDLDDLATEIEHRKYYRQLAYYRHLAAEEFGHANVRCAIIAIEKDSPYCCGVYFLSDDLLAIGDAYNFASLANLAECRRTGNWGGNPATREVGPSAELRFRMMEESLNAG